MTETGNDSAGTKPTTGTVKPPRKARRRDGDDADAAAPKMAEELAHRIESEIMRLGWPQGRILGTELELIEKYGVSRAVFREAVRLVEHHGAAQMRRGPKGGLIVRIPSFRSVQRPATLYLDYANVSTSDLITARSALELSAVALVADRVTEDGIRQLQEVLAHEEEVGLDNPSSGVSHELHVLIARLSGNPVHLLFLQTLASLTFERTKDLPFDRTATQESHRAHEAIVEAIIAGDSGLAQHRLRRHLEAAISSYQQRGAELERKTGD